MQAEILAFSWEVATLAVVMLGALVAGFTTGFAGFGTGLVASGLWFHALPANLVPPLVVIASLVAQLMSLATVRKAFDWSRAMPYLVGGGVGVPFGVVALATASPALLRTSIGAFLVAYAAYQLMQRRSLEIGAWGGRWADAVVGIGGGFLGGFAGLSGPLPLIWLRLRGGDSTTQRATYQPFNIVVLALAGAALVASGQVTAELLSIVAIACPATLVGAWIGAHAYVGVSQQVFQRLVLALLLVSGCILVAPSLMRQHSG